MIDDMDVQSQSIIENVMNLVYYMRGGVSYTEVMFMSAGERSILAGIINRRIKEAANHPNPTLMI